MYKYLKRSLIPETLCISYASVNLYFFLYKRQKIRLPDLKYPNETGFLKLINQTERRLIINEELLNFVFERKIIFITFMVG
jgi:hypothetical protein